MPSTVVEAGADIKVTSESNNANGLPQSFLEKALRGKKYLMILMYVLVFELKYVVKFISLQYLKNLVLKYIAF